jgi:hypothetical protein
LFNLFESLIADAAFGWRQNLEAQSRVSRRDSLAGFRWRLFS